MVLMALTVSAFAQTAASSRYYNPKTGRIDYRGGSLGDNYFDDPMYFGFRLGPAFSSIGSGDNAGKATGLRTGLNIGGIVGIALTDVAPLFLETGLSYTQKGGRAKVANTTYNRAINYFELPIQFKYIYTAYDKFTVQPLIGAYVAYGVGGKSSFDNSLVGSGASFADGRYRHWDAGIRFGVGAGYDIAYLEMVYDLGIANIAKSETFSAHNRSLYLTIGVNF